MIWRFVVNWTTLQFRSFRVHHRRDRILFRVVSGRKFFFRFSIFLRNSTERLIAVLSGLKQLLLFSGMLLENMILERDNFFGHLLHLQCLVELMLLHKVFLSRIAFSFMTRPRALSRNLFFIFSPNMAHFRYLLSIECVCLVAISFVLIQRFSRY